MGDQNDELAGIVDEALGASGDSEGSTHQGYTQDQGQNELLARTSGGQGQEGQRGNNPLLAGKYKTAQELEKAYKLRDSQASQFQTKAQKLEALIQNPRLMALAQQDPQLREALGKLGYQIRQEDTQEERESGGEGWNGDENDPRFQIAVSEQRQELRWELFEFGQQRGKALSPEEQREVKRVIGMAPKLTVEQAYRLTPFYEKDVKAREDARIAALEKRAAKGGRPAPNPGLPGGQKLDLKKSVLEMNDAERRAFIQQTIEGAE